MYVEIRDTCADCKHFTLESSKHTKVDEGICRPDKTSSGTKVLAADGACAGFADKPETKETDDQTAEVEEYQVPRRKHKRGGSGFRAG